MQGYHIRVSSQTIKLLMGYRLHSRSRNSLMFRSSTRCSSQPSLSTSVCRIAISLSQQRSREGSEMKTSPRAQALALLLGCFTALSISAEAHSVPSQLAPNNLTGIIPSTSLRRVADDL